MTDRQTGPSLIASLSCVLLLSAGVSAQEVYTTMMIAPGENRMVEISLAAHLTKARMEVMVPMDMPRVPVEPKAPPRKLTEGDLMGVDLLIHYKVEKRADGIYEAKVWVVERVSGDTVIQVEGDAGRKRVDRGPSINRAMDDAANAAGAKLIAAIRSYKEGLSKNGSPYRIELRKLPLKATLAITSLLMKKSSKVKEAKATKGAKAWLIRTKMDTLDLASAIWKQVEENAPKADDCKFLIKIRGYITLACKH